MYYNLDRILIIVDGPTENKSLKQFFQKDNHNSPSFRLGPGNGEDFSLEGYSKGVLPLLKYALSSDFRAIILTPDFEKRKMGYTKFAKLLKERCISALANETKYNAKSLQTMIFVCPPNIMFENWIVADIASVSEQCEEFDEKVNQEIYEGKNGGSILKKNMNCKYKKTVHAHKFFKRINSSEAKKNSESFQRFLDLIDELHSKHCIDS